MIIKFKRWSCTLKWGRYENGRIALQLMDVHGHECIAKATVNLPDHPLKWDEVFIKDWSKNEGMLKALEQAGIIDPNGMEVTGHTRAFRCRLLVQPG